jgi:hypothetical protein
MPFRDPPLMLFPCTARPRYYSRATPAQEKRLIISLSPFLSLISRPSPDYSRKTSQHVRQGVEDLKRSSWGRSASQSPTSRCPPPTYKHSVISLILVFKSKTYYFPSFLFPSTFRNVIQLYPAALLLWGNSSKPFSLFFYESSMRLTAISFKRRRFRHPNFMFSSFLKNFFFLSAAKKNKLSVFILFVV